MADLSAENEIVLATVQAFVGAITPTMSAISLEADADKETRRWSRCTRGSVTTGGSGWPGRDKRMIYAAYER